MKLRFAAWILLAAPLLAMAQSPAPECDRRTAADYVSMTRTDRLAEYVRDLVYPDAFLYSGALAGVGQGLDRPKEWGDGYTGYGRRFASAFAVNVLSSSFQDGLALGLDQDNRYFASGRHGFGRRLGYALSSAFLARHSDGSRVLSVSALGGVGGAAFLAETWQPPSTSGARYAVRTIGFTFAFRMGLDVFREFAPPRLAQFFQ